MSQKPKAGAITLVYEAFTSSTVKIHTKHLPPEPAFRGWLQAYSDNISSLLHLPFYHKTCIRAAKDMASQLARHYLDTPSEGEHDASAKLKKLIPTELVPGEMWTSS